MRHAGDLGHHFADRDAAFFAFGHDVPGQHGAHKDIVLVAHRGCQKFKVIAFGFDHFGKGQVGRIGKPVLEFRTDLEEVARNRSRITTDIGLRTGIQICQFAFRRDQGGHGRGIFDHVLQDHGLAHGFAQADQRLAHFADFIGPDPG